MTYLNSIFKYLIGVMLGYLVAAISINFFQGMFSWRSAIMFQAICELPVVVAFLCQDNKYIDVLSITIY